MLALLAILILSFFDYRLREWLFTILVTAAFLADVFCFVITLKHFIYCH